MAGQLFGEEGSIAMSRIDTATLRQATEDVLAFGVVVSEQDADQIERTNDAISRLGLIWRGLSNQLAVAAAPALEAVANAMAAVASRTGPLGIAIRGLFDNIGRFHWGHLAIYAALDLHRQVEVLELVRDLAAQTGMVAIIALHDLTPIRRAERLRADLDLLPQLAEAGLADAAKDISMAGAVGTLLMMLDCSRCGALIDVDAMPRPRSVDVNDPAALLRWLTAFPSYGFVFSLRPAQVATVLQRFAERGIAAAAV